MMNKTTLCVCQRGNVRSVTVATILKDYAMYNDVVVCGHETTTPETFARLCAIADNVLLCGTPAMTAHVAPEYRGKVSVIDVGHDTYGKAMHPVLVRKAIEALDRHDLIERTRWPKVEYLSMVDQTHYGKSFLETGAT